MLPELIVKDLAASVAFYALLGFRIAYERSAERFAYLTRGSGVDLMLEQVNPEDRLYPRAAFEHPYGRGMNLSIEVEDANAVHRAVLAAGHQVRHPVTERWYARADDEVGERELTVADPDGYLLRPTQNLGTRPRAAASRP